MPLLGVRKGTRGGLNVKLSEGLPEKWKSSGGNDRGRTSVL